jgi:RNA methyltransferase, TrmH family, group 1
MKKNSILERIHIVLVDTQDGANIGAVCRAMKTMGLTRLDLVTDRVYDESRVRTLALHAADLWENATFYKTLPEALKNSVYSVAATRRRGKFRKLSSLSPDQLAERVAQIGEGEISIVFGRESDGLTDDEVQCCSTVVTIPTSELFPSLNLSQAVQIITYTLFKSSLEYKPGMNAVTKERVALAADKCTAALDGIGYFKWDEERKWGRQLIEDTMERATLSESEIQRIEKLFTKIALIKIHKEKDNEI